MEIANKSTSKRGILKQNLISILQDDDWENKFNLWNEVNDITKFNLLFSIIYNDSILVKWRAVSAFGVLTQKLKFNETKKIREIIRRCVWMLTEESGGIPWMAPAIMGEIMANHNELRDEFINILFSYINESEDGADNFLEHTPLRTDAFWGILRIAQIEPMKVNVFSEIIIKRMSCEEEPAIVSMLCLIAGYSGIQKAKEIIALNINDSREIQIFLNGNIQTNTVGELANQASAMLQLFEN